MRGVFNIPSALMKQCLSESSLKYFKLYLVLKDSCDGSLVLNQTIKTSICSRLQISRRTLYRQLNWLLDANWIGKNEKFKKYYIRSFVTVCKIEEVQHIQCYKFNIRQLDMLDKFAFACAITDIIKYQKKLGWLRSCKSGRRFKSPPFFPISISYVSAYIKIGKNKCVQLMKNNYYISKKKDTTALLYGGKTIDNRFYAITKKSYDSSYLLKGKDGVLITSNPNLFRSKLEPMKRRNY